MIGYKDEVAREDWTTCAREFWKHIAYRPGRTLVFFRIPNNCNA